MIYITVCNVLDLCDFNKVVKSKAFKTRNAAEKWGDATRDELANRDLSKGIEIVGYGYETYTYEFVNY